MTSDTDLPTVDEIFTSLVNDLHSVRGHLWKAASRLGVLDELRMGLPLTAAQSQARSLTLGALDDAKGAIERAQGALNNALRDDDPTGS